MMGLLHASASNHIDVKVKAIKNDRITNKVARLSKLDISGELLGLLKDTK